MDGSQHYPMGEVPGQCIIIAHSETSKMKTTCLVLKGSFFSPSPRQTMTTPFISLAPCPPQKITPSKCRFGVHIAYFACWVFFWLSKEHYITLHYVYRHYNNCWRDSPVFFNKHVKWWGAWDLWSPGKFRFSRAFRWRLAGLSVRSQVVGSWSSLSFRGFGCSHGPLWHAYSKVTTFHRKHACRRV